MKSNFEFLNRYWPALAQIGAAAESYVYSDANACLYKLGMFGERLILEIFAFEHIKEPTIDNTHANRIRLLKREGLIPKKIDDILYALRKTRNDAVHAGADSVEDAKTLLSMTYNLAVWFMEVYGDWGYIAPAFVMPENVVQPDYESIIKEQEEKIVALSKQVDAVSTAASSKTSKERAEKGETASESMDLSEAETRYLIDEQFRKFDWEADTNNLRYSRGTRPQKGRNLAIAEWPTDSTVGKNGYADYALFVGLKLVGIVEAKKAAIDIPSVIDHQCKEYAKGIKAEHKDYVIGQWGAYKVPFVFATNGRKYLKQIETKSGIWCLDLRSGANAPKALQGWISPQGLMEQLEKDIAAANAALQNTPFDLLRDPDGLNLRKYQISAIEAAEQAVIDGKQTVLLSMATGTGKTRTILGMIYRFIKSDRFKRVLFLVDRTALGEQAEDVFKEVKIEELMTLDSIYNIKGLDEKEIDKETKIHIATVQSLVKRILYPENDTMPSVTDYDLIVVDEAHRGYILDKEMSETEMLYRNQDDYISKYRTVIEYFDAVKIALTATPALHTTEIFGKPVFNYSYREAVIDGYLVDHDAPHNIRTKLRVEGINYQKGEQLAIYDPVTGEVLNSAELEDDMKFEIDTFNRQVITENFNRTVLEEIAWDFNPDGQGKTLIYAVDDNHADLIVKILKEIYAEGGVDNDTVMKITGSVAGGNKKKISEAIKRFKNESLPKIVVTVDLLTTGIDVPEITTLVFMRRIKSRILFEQMLGRATRLCPSIGKTHFEIYDPVGVYESLQDVSNMKPVVTNPSTSFEDLMKGLEVAATDEQLAYQIDLIVAKLQRKRRNVSKKALEQFAYLTGGKDLGVFAEHLNSSTIKEATAELLGHREAFSVLDKDRTHRKRPVVIDNHEDELIDHTRGYGEGQKPEDYLEAFREFINNNINAIAALRTVCTRPSELTREALKSLKLELDRHDFTEKRLNSAWNEMTNQDIVADIIAFIRQQALGSALVGHEQRVKHAFAKLRMNHEFNKTQLEWLKRIEKVLLEESVLDEQIFEVGAFKNAGGFTIIDRRFGGKLREIMTELNEYLYDDGGSVA
ncbi:type I restriction-modification system endonuclease [Dysosmobacter segnis]|uniref:Type I restriction-modification system endonuclease n=1 Tax=Dysosmobacter segnis TaxID=2763042 RepID=A0A923S863_9FIRM|nr:type I restriction-modification system endonuclease [Dysosmobacter segnis]MBC5771381.1 type I restriction-modification system endonuclease [Dysosmobacter segnis]